jgi:hypothetical protein
MSMPISTIRTAQRPLRAVQLSARTSHSKGAKR